MQSISLLPESTPPSPQEDSDAKALRDEFESTALALAQPRELRLRDETFQQEEIDQVRVVRLAACLAVRLESRSKCFDWSYPAAQRTACG